MSPITCSISNCSNKKQYYSLILIEFVIFYCGVTMMINHSLIWIWCDPIKNKKCYCYSLYLNYSSSFYLFYKKHSFTNLSSFHFQTKDNDTHMYMHPWSSQSHFFYTLVYKPTHCYNFSLLTSFSWCILCINKCVCLIMYRIYLIDKWLCVPIINNW